MNCPPEDETLRTLRDRAILSMMIVEGLRRVEIYRSSIEDLQIVDGVQKFIARGKGPKKIGLLRKETNTAIENYLT